MENSPLKSDLNQKIKDSIQKEKKGETVPIGSIKNEIVDNDPVTRLETRMEDLISTSNYKELLDLSQGALDSYPLQPYFYYAYGSALSNTGDSNKGIEVLESGLDYILDNKNLKNKIYKQLWQAYNKIGNTQKANEYLNKVNSGL